MKSKTKESEERMIHVRLSLGTHRALRLLAAERDTTIQRLVSQLIEDNLKRR